jgi:LmbE family N-acetylglucosaminyl deacetylase
MLNSKSRLMMMAPHPDDESLAAGILLQKAVAAGAAVRVVYATDGDDNPWPQRALERKWRLNADDRRRWGRLRRREAIAALETLGLRAVDARFLGLPDQGLTRLALHDCSRIATRLARMIADWAPTHLLFPSLRDTHPDHSGLALLLRFATADLPKTKSIKQWSYIVHGKRELFAGSAYALKQSSKEQARKSLAIACHCTQTKFSRRRFMSYAKRAELLLSANQHFSPAGKGSIGFVSREEGQLHLFLRFSFRPLRRDKTTLYLVGYDRSGAPASVCLRLPARNAEIQVTDCTSGRRVGLATYRGNAASALITMKTGWFATNRSLLAKLDRRFWFFDETGWTEIQPERSRARFETFDAQILA